MTNVDQKLSSFRDRFLRLETEKRERSEDLAELRKEMKSNGLSADEIAAVALAVKRSFESAEKTAKRKSVEDIAESLGQLTDLPLGQAAMRA